MSADKAEAYLFHRKNAFSQHLEILAYRSGFLSKFIFGVCVAGVLIPFEGACGGRAWIYEIDPDTSRCSGGSHRTFAHWCRLKSANTSFTWN